MNHLLWYNGKDDAGSAWGMSTNSAAVLADALKAAGYKVVWMIHSTVDAQPMIGYEDALEEYRRDAR
jgi:hypothetical protein